MVTILPREENGWNEGFRNLGQGFSQAYMNQSDESAVRKAISDLGPNASARDLLNALTNAKTYSNEAKQRALSNYLGVEQMESLKEKAKAQKEFERERFEEEKRASTELENYRNRSLDIQGNRASKSVHGAQTAGQLKSGLQTVKEMKDIGKKGNLGWGTGIRKTLSAEAAKDAAQYSQLGKSLISLATTIPIRNRQEFETLAHDLYDPSIRDAAREGILNAMENILTRSLDEASQGIDQEASSKQENSQERIRVKNKKTGQTGSILPYEGMEEDYELISGK